MGIIMTIKNTVKAVKAWFKAIGLHLSDGNGKIGRKFNFNLVPGLSCSRAACETCHKDGCYAVKAWKQHPNVRKAWNENTELALYNPEKIEEGINAILALSKKPVEDRYFRIHSAGDFITAEYAWVWYRIAKNNPTWKFLAFTKQFDIIRGIPFHDLPNFSLVLSEWPGIEIPEDLKKLYPVAYLDDGNREPGAIPENAVECAGSCVNCCLCWGLAKQGINVKFYKH